MVIILQGTLIYVYLGHIVFVVIGLKFHFVDTSKLRPSHKKLNSFTNHKMEKSSKFENITPFKPKINFLHFYFQNITCFKI